MNFLILAVMVIEDSLQVYAGDPFEVLEFSLFLAKVGMVNDLGEAK